MQQKITISLVTVILKFLVQIYTEKSHYQYG